MVPSGPDEISIATTSRRSYAHLHGRKTLVLPNSSCRRRSPCLVTRSRERRHSCPRRRYRCAVASNSLFGLGAALDLGWHEVFGFEVSNEALLSPSHLVLMAGAMLALSGPVRSGWTDLVAESSLTNRIPMTLVFAAFVGVDTLLRRTTSTVAIGAALPAILWSGCFFGLYVAKGVQWSPSLWAGVIVLGSLIGAVVGMLAAPSPHRGPHAAMSATNQPTMR